MKLTMVGGTEIGIRTYALVRPSVPGKNLHHQAWAGGHVHGQACGKSEPALLTDGVGWGVFGSFPCLGGLTQ
jgi:hypothetical protein